MSDLRASELRVGDLYEEDGMDPVRVLTIEYFGDNVLVTSSDAEEIALDIDTVVDLVERTDSYSIIRFYFAEDKAREIIETGLTLAEAQAHCQDESTHGGSTEDGTAWFDGYDED